MFCLTSVHQYRSQRTSRKTIIFKESLFQILSFKIWMDGKHKEKNLHFQSCVLFVNTSLTMLYCNEIKRKTLKQFTKT